MNTTEAPQGEQSFHGTTETPLTAKDEKDIYDALVEVCAVRNACGCNPLSSEESLNRRLGVLRNSLVPQTTSHHSDIPLPQLGESQSCDTTSISNTLNQRLHPQTIQMAKNGLNDSTVTATWNDIRQSCSDLPSTMTEWMNQEDA